MNTDHDCPECGKRRINTPSGSVCPDGHGRLFPRIILKPFETLDVPRDIAICPECNGDLEVECNEWTEDDGASKPTSSGFDVTCQNSDLVAEEGYHAYHQCDWQPVRDRVSAWLGAVES